MQCAVWWAVPNKCAVVEKRLGSTDLWVELNSASDDKQLIVWHYLKPWFCVDVVCSLFWVQVGAKRHVSVQQYHRTYDQACSLLRRWVACLSITALLLLLFPSAGPPGVTRVEARVSESRWKKQRTGSVWIGVGACRFLYRRAEVEHCQERFICPVLQHGWAVSHFCPWWLEVGHWVFVSSRGQ